MGCVVEEEDLQTGEVTRRGPFVTEQEARMALANAVEQAYGFNPRLATDNVRQEVEDAVRDGHKDCLDVKGNFGLRGTGTTDRLISDIVHGGFVTVAPSVRRLRADCRSAVRKGRRSK